MYTIEFSREAGRTFARLPSDLRSLISKKIEAIAAEPGGAHNNVTRLRGRSEFRLRVHDWRVIYRLIDDRLVLLVIKIGTRGQVYE